MGVLHGLACVLAGATGGLADLLHELGLQPGNVGLGEIPVDPDAEDVLQEVFWQVWQEASRYDERRGSPEAWLLNRARSRAIDKLRSIRRIGETFATPVDEEIAREPAGRMGNLGTLAENRGMVRTALALLPDPQRQVIELAFLGGLPQSEIARRLGQPLGTIKTRIRAGLERLRGHFRASGGATS
jgi:RNA polymerase sigma-70 factor (ECF subfamily)